MGEGDMRKYLNILQATAMGFATINADAVYATTGLPRPTDIAEIANALFNMPYQEAFTAVTKIGKEKNISLQDIIKEVYVYILRMEFPKPAARIQLLTDLCGAFSLTRKTLTTRRNRVSLEPRRIREAAIRRVGCCRMHRERSNSCISSFLKKATAPEFFT